MNKKRSWTLTRGQIKDSKGRWINIIVTKGPMPGESERVLVKEINANYLEKPNE